MGNMLPAPVSYDDTDFDSLDKRLVKLCASVFPDLDLNDVAELARMLLDEGAHVGDVLMFYLRKAGREARITTATQRKSLLGLVKLIGYTPRGTTAAQVTETFTLAAPAAANVVFPAGTIVKTPSITTPARFRLLADLTILTGQSVGSGTVEHSAAAQDAFDSAGTANQQFLLSRTPYLDDSAVVVAANGAYSKVSNFLASQADDLHYVTVVDQLDRATIRFGDGILGAIPAGTITVDYKTGGGSSGQLIPGALSQLEGSFADANGTPVRVTVTNAEKTSGGLDRQSNASIQLLAPESLRVLTRVIAREDYEIAAKQVAGVSRALMLTRNESTSITENHGILFVVPTGGGVPSQSLLDAVAAQWGSSGPYKKANTFQIAVQVPNYLVVDVVSTLWLRKGLDSADGRAKTGAAIRAELANFFAIDVPDLNTDGTPNPLAGTPNPLIDFGYYTQDDDGNPTEVLSWSDVFNTIRDTTGVLKLDPGGTGLTLNGKAEDPPILAWQFPVLGTVTLIDAKSGLSF